MMRVIICGAGQVGFNLARYLSERNNHVTVIDSSADLINKLNDRLDVKAICGFASHPEVLESAGAASADMLIAVTYSDEVNMIACEIAHALFKVPTKISRIRNQDYLDPKWSRLFSKEHLSIDVVISPEIEVAKAISQSLSIPGAFDLISLANGRVNIVAVRCTQDTPVINTPISHVTSLYPNLDLTVIGIVREESNFLPQPQDILQVGDAVYFAVAQEQIPLAMNAFGIEYQAAHKLLILGGGNIGLSLAQEIELSHPGIHIEIIEKNPIRAETIASTLKKTIVLCGDALDSELLQEASVSTTKTVVALTEDDRVNTLASLLAKRLGAKRALALINNTSHAPLVTSLGVDAIISPRKVTVSKILQYVRRGRIRSVHSLGENFGEIIEAEAVQSSSLIGLTVQTLNSDKEIIIAAIIRNNEVIIPLPSTVIQLDDLIIIMVANRAISKIEKLFSARIDYY